MSGRLQYVGKRARSAARVVATPIGGAVIGAAVVSVAAVLASGTATTVLTVVAVVLWTTVALLLASRLSVMNQRVSAARGLAAPKTVVTASAGPAGSTAGSPSTESRRLASAMGVLATAAGSRVTGGVHAVDDADPLVTVVIPCFNDAKYVATAITSVQQQTFSQWECIVVDDASTDDSAQVAWAQAKGDDRVRITRHARNAGLSAARNTGIRLARGEYITFLDSDDFLTPASLADRVSRMLAVGTEELVAGVYCGVTLAPHDADLADYAHEVAWKGGAVDFVASGDGCPFNVHAALVRTEIVRRAGGFDEGMLDGAEDWDLWYRVLRSGYRILPSELMSAVYRQKQGSMKQASAHQHFAESSRLTTAAFTHAQEDALIPGAPQPARAPKQEYQAAALLARRSIQSAATAYLGGGAEPARAILEELDPVHPLVLSSFDVSSAITDGFRRYLGLMPNEIRSLRASLEAAGAAMAEIVDEVVAFEEPQPAPGNAPGADVWLIPQNAAELAAMEAALEGEDFDLASIDPSYATSDQGLISVLQQRDGEARVLSFNEACLGSHAPRVAVVARPPDVGLSVLLTSLRDRGTAVVGLEGDLDGVVHLECAAELTVGAWAQAGELAATIRAANEEGHERPASEVVNSVDPWKVAGAWVVEEYPDSFADTRDMTGFRGVHEGERVIIIGNGPSLNDIDLSLLDGERTIGVNGIFYADDRLPAPLTYYVVEDSMVVKDNLDRIREYRAGHRFFPSIYRSMIGEADDTTYFRMNRGFYDENSPNYCVPRFSADPAQRVYAGQSVTIMNLQLAYFMGFREVVLIGMDFSYTIPDSAEVRGALITSAEDDPNHFHPEYFGKGKVWKDPKLDRVLANYALAKQIFEADGRRILNATPGGNLNLFDRVDLGEAIRS